MTSQRPSPMDLLEPLEPRQLLTVNILDDVGNRTASSGASATVIDLTNRYDSPDLTGSIYRFNSVLGAFHIEMFDAAGQARTRTTPQTVANFNQYVTNNRYTNSFIHRSVPNFVLQGGGYTAADLPTLFQEITAFPPVVNEPGNTNIRGTIAMAKLGSSPNSATSQWFINLANNAANLDNQNGGFTAFGRVIGNGMTVVDALAAIPNYPFASPFDNVPLRNYTQQDFNNEVPPRPDHLVLFSTIEQVSELTYTVTSTNTALVNPVIVGNRLVLDHGAGMTGSANVTVRVTAADGSFVDDTFSVNVSNPVAPANLAVTPVRVTAAGNAVTFTATGPGFANPAINNVKFYRDINNNGVRDTADLANGLIDIDDEGSDGYTIVVPFSGAEFVGVAGGQIFFAIGFIDGTETGTIAFAAASFNRAPTMGFFLRYAEGYTSQPDVVSGVDNLIMHALNVFDPDGTIARVQFFRDANGNGVFDSGIDVFLGEDTTPTDGFRIAVSAAGFSPGATTSVFAVAVDAEGQSSSAASRTVRSGATLAIGSLTVAPSPVERGTAFTATARDITVIPGGQPAPATLIGRVEFYLDVNGNGEIDAGLDLVIGQQTSAVGGAYLLTTAVQVPAGTYSILARAIDRIGAIGTLASTPLVITGVNQAPSIATLAISPAPLLPGQAFEVIAMGVEDVDGVVAEVRFYRDANANGTLELGLDELLGIDMQGNDGFQVSGFAPAGTGQLRIFAVATDNEGAPSAVYTAVVTVRPPGPTHWTGQAGDGRWGTPGNWQYGFVPAAGEDVVIDVPGSAIVLVDSPGVVFALQSLTLAETVVLSTGGLLIQHSVLILEDGRMELSGGTLEGTVESAIVNQGVISQTTITSTDLRMRVVSSGLIALESGRLSLLNGGLLGGSISIAQSGLLELSGDFGSAAGLSITGLGVLRMTGAALTIQTAVVLTPRSLSIDSLSTLVTGESLLLPAEVALEGTLGGAGDLIVTGSLVWAAGSIIGAGRLIVIQGASMVAQVNELTLGRHVLNAGLFRNEASLDLEGRILTNLAGATLALVDGATVGDNGEVMNHGVVMLAPGTAIGARFRNAGTVEVRGSTTLSQVTSINAGRLTEGTWRVIQGSLSTPGLVSENAAVVELSSHGSWLALNAISVNAGILTLGSGRQFVASGAFGIPGGFVNAGTMRLMAGAAFTAVGDFTQTAAGSLELVVRDDGVAGRLVTTGTAWLGGSLTVAGGPLPPVGTAVRIVSAGTVVGTFSQVALPRPLGAVQASILSGISTVDVVFRNRLDRNGDGEVDADDLSDFITLFFAVPGDPLADFNGDGQTDADDLADFIALFFSR